MILVILLVFGLCAYKAWVDAWDDCFGASKPRRPRKRGRRRR